ncbi:fungal-specific transcription factor domain-containing protein [Leptodontidium sp. MPI-SDFR-AT-0119]|nr:fungal-specific transcription factor domain-containing protein [Leptodontidium sp. MPI-SDFR-AT-0119]
MISLEEMMQLLQKFFEFTMPIDRLFHRPTIEKWLREFHETMGSMKKNEDASARRSVLWMKRGVVSLASVQARLCQCFWLLSRSRTNHCWDIFGSAARLALVLGLHRKPPPTSTSTRSLVDLECGRRTFWSAYCLDNHLSITLGRPRIFHDDDIDQDFPSGVDDDELFTQQPVLRNSHVYSTMLAPVAYFKLYRIMSIVLRDLYSIHPASIVRQYEFAERYSQVLREWRDDIPRFLDADSNGSTPLIPIFQRQRDVLNLAYWHAMVLTHRPLLLRNFAKIQCGNHENTTHEPHVERSVRECLDAAMHIVDRMDDMFQSGLMFRSFWGTCYFGFSAAVVLYVYAIQQSFSSLVNTYQIYLDAAIRCQN